jgi:hypothetical protein
MELREAEQIYKSTMAMVGKWFAATTAIDEKHRQLSGVDLGNPVSSVEFGSNFGFFRRYRRGAIFESLLSLGRAMRPAGAKKSADARQERVHLEQSAAALARFGQHLSSTR